MNFFLDNDVPVELGRMLQLKGHSVEILKEVLPRDTDDLSALRHAANKGMIVITCNRRDFLKLAESEPHVGIIILVRSEGELRNARLSSACSPAPTNSAFVTTSISRNLA